MCAGVRHRGPDARGVHRERHVWLGIQRLRVIDLDTGDQPIYNEDRSVVVVLNGEIYNYRELRRELERRGHRFATNGDTEVIVHMYEEHGPDCVRRLHGMFAFALWDRGRRQMMLARDRVGKKPLLYALAAGRLTFASEMGALLEDEQIAREVDRVAIDAYLALGYVPGTMTAVRGVRKLPAAHTLLIVDGRANLQRYWKLDYATKMEGVAVGEVCERIRAAVRAATRRRLVADVPVGAFLSGGIDSSAVVAAMAEASSEPVRTFSIGFDHADFDELRYARMIAERFGAVHEEFVVRADAVDVVPRIVRHHGEPFADAAAIPSFYLAELTRRRVTVVLNGDGGDESFGGYSRYVANAVGGRLERIPPLIRRGLTAISRRVSEAGDVASVANKARRLASTLALERPARYTWYMSWFTIDQREALYTPGFARTAGSSGEDLIASVWAETSGASVVDKMLEVDVATYLADFLMPKTDIATMAHGLEARSPLLDHELMELAAAIPASLKIRGNQKKWILREALRGWVPDAVLDRPKHGFTVPLSAWLRNDLRSWSRDVLLDRTTLARGYFEQEPVRRLLDRHDAGSDVDANRIWALLMLELWHREFIDTPARASAGLPKFVGTFGPFSG